MIKKYEKYKDSGVEWIGEIPEEWEVKRLKYLVSKTGSGVTPKGGASVYQVDGIPLLRSQNIHFSGLRLDDVAYITEETHDEMENSKVFSGDVLLNITGASIGRCYFTDDSLGEANVNQHVCIIRSKPVIGTKYLYYLIRSDVGQKQIDIEQTGSGREGLNFEVLKNFLLPVSSNSEQNAIASYLDRKTTEIDQLIANKEKLIALYEEEKTAIINHAVTKGLDPKVRTKPSGIEWLGNIPEHWEVKRLKWLSTIISKGTTPSTIGREILPSGDIRFIKAENVLNNTIVAEPNNFIDQNTNEMLSRSQLEESDILFVIAGATIGKVAILPAKFCPANTNQAVSFIRLKNRDNALFVWYWLHSYFINKILWIDAVQSAQPNLSMENLGNFYVPSPPVIEQTAIVAHIETECSRLDTIIEKFKKQIDLFKEYRTTLISEVVTGKIDVCDEVAA